MKNKKILNFLLSNGIKAHLKGFTYLYDAIEILLNDKKRELKIVHDVYPKVADKHNTTWSRVERCVRTAIHTSRGEYKKKTPSEFFSIAIILILCGDGND